MNVNDLIDGDFGQNAQKSLNNSIAQLHMGDKRKPQLTLSRLNKLRKLRELKKYQRMKRDDLAKIMYGIPSEDAGF